MTLAVHFFPAAEDSLGGGGPPSLPPLPLHGNKPSGRPGLPVSGHGPGGAGSIPVASAPAGGSGRREAWTGLCPPCRDSWGQSPPGDWSTRPVSHNSAAEAPSCEWMCRRAHLVSRPHAPAALSVHNDILSCICSKPLSASRLALLRLEKGGLVHWRPRPPRRDRPAGSSPTYLSVAVRTVGDPRALGSTADPATWTDTPPQALWEAWLSPGAAPDNERSCYYKRRLRDSGNAELRRRLPRPRGAAFSGPRPHRHGHRHHHGPLSPDTDPPTSGAFALPAASPARAPGATMVMDGQLVLQVPDVPGEQGGLVPTAHMLLASQPLGEKPPAEGRLGHL